MHRRYSFTIGVLGWKNRLIEKAISNISNNDLVNLSEIFTVVWCVTLA